MEQGCHWSSQRKTRPKHQANRHSPPATGTALPLGTGLTHLMIPLHTSRSRSRQIGQYSSSSIPLPASSGLGGLALMTTLVGVGVSVAVDVASLSGLPSALLAFVPAPRSEKKRSAAEERYVYICNVCKYKVNIERYTSVTTPRAVKLLVPVLCPDQYWYWGWCWCC